MGFPDDLNDVPRSVIRISSAEHRRGRFEPKHYLPLFFEYFFSFVTFSPAVLRFESLVMDLETLKDQWTEAEERDGVRLSWNTFPSTRMVCSLLDSM